MRILRRSQYRSMPWKNGGGETIEVTVSPPAAGLNDFDWRVSMAQVKADGPFSVFDGIDRTLSILEGEGMMLSIDGTAHRLTQESTPLAFPADVPTQATLIDGAITDLNIMTRRGKYAHGVQRLHVEGVKSFVPSGDVLLMMCHRGTLSVACNGQNASLGAIDTLIEDSVQGAWTLSAASPATVYVVMFSRLA